MLKNYLTVALRALRKQKLYSTINIVGLALGITCCILLGLFVADEVTFDRMHSEGDRIYRVARISYNPDGSARDENPTPFMPVPAGPALLADLPEVEHFVRFSQSSLLMRHETTIADEGVLFADPSIFEVFTFESIAGDAATALAQPNAAVLNAEIAQKYFGDANAVGQPFELWIDGAFRPFIVTAVMEVRDNSTVRFDVLLPRDQIYRVYPWMEGHIDRFNATSTLTYVQLHEGADLASVEAKMPAFIGRHYGEHIAEMREEGAWTGEGQPLSYYFQPLARIHLDPAVDGGITPPSNPLYSKILGGIALAVLLIASINFTTLAIGRSMRRAREVGVRKAVGAHRGQLARQFIGEALLLSTLALGIGIALAALFLPTFNTLTGKALSFGLVNGPLALAALAALALVTGLVAGSYPALLLARLKPVDSLKDRVRLGGSQFFARGLVVVQFSLSVALLAGTLVLGAQMRYLQSRDLGYDREAVAVIPVREHGGEQALDRLRTTTASNPAVESVTGISYSFGRGMSTYGFQYKGEDLDIVVYRVGSDFIETMGMDVIAGRTFDPRLATDSTESVVINEALARRLGFDDPLGQPIEDFEMSDVVKEPTVIGIVRDFNFRSLHNAVEPALFTLDPEQEIEYALVRLAPASTREGIGALEDAWAEIAPGLPFDYGFLDDDLADYYESEARWAQIVRWATLFALAVACLGLFGLASLTVTQRTKEIGIRKVLGASVSDIAVLVSKGFAVLVGLAVLIAAPLAWFAAGRWLDGFAYRIELGPGLFLLAGGLALAVAVVTVSAQALRAAAADPVRSLRHE